jgi:hypothetical protein
VKRVVTEQLEGEGVEDVAAAGFRAGWRCACLAVADGLADAVAPAVFVAAVRAAADKPPPDLKVKTFTGNERAP